MGAGRVAAGVGDDPRSPAAWVQGAIHASPVTCAFGVRVQGSGFRVQGSGFRVQGSGFRVQGLGFRV